MNKFNSIALTALATLTLGACSSEQVPDGGAEGEVVVVNYSLSLPSQIASRAYGQAATDIFGEANEVKTLHYAVYATGSTTPLFDGVCYGVFGSGDVTHQLPLSLVTGKTYDLVFWADAATESVPGMYTFNVDGQTIEANYTSMANFTETADGFFGQVVGMKVTGAMSRDVELRRPFAQLNIGTDDVALTSPAVKAVSVTVPVYSKFNLLTGEVSGTASTVTFGPTDFTSYVAPFPVAHAETGKTYQYLAMDYLLVNQRELVTVTMQTDDATADPRVYNNVPVQRNYRTNIYGSLLTTAFNFAIQVKPEFYQPDYDAEQLEQTLVAEGLYSNAKGYSIASAAGLVYLSKHSSLIGPNDVVVLTSDIDLEGVDDFKGLSSWYPENPCTFDGQYHTVSNWSSTTGESDKGFINNWVGPIKNVTLKDFTLVTRGRSGLLCAKPYGDIIDCHVIGGSITDSYWAAGALAGMLNKGNIINCSVEGVKISSNGGVGGLVGVINETKGTRKIENCSVTNCTINRSGSYGSVYAGGELVGMLNIENSTVNVINCAASGNTLTNITKLVGWWEDSTTLYIDGVKQ